MSLVLENISLKVAAETHIYPSDINLETGMNVVIGPTLSGKTTLLRLIAGLDKPSSGRLLLSTNNILIIPT
jgi:glycerol transport system ATP-binding protein